MAENTDNFYDLKANDDQGNEVKMSKYKGFVLLIINVASECGYTSSNYQILSKLLDEYYEKGLRVLLFPCNQFGNQEPENICKIKDTITNKYNMDKFDLFEKSNVNGDDANEVFKYLKKQSKKFLMERIMWNFTKFLVDREGNVIKRYSSGSFPKKEELEKLLNKVRDL